MKDFKQKVLEVEKKFNKLWGGFYLFALFEREDLDNKYDLIISMDIRKMSEKELYQSLHSEFTKVLTKEELTIFSRFIYLDSKNPVVLAINSLVDASHSIIDVKDCFVNNMKIYHAIVFSSQRVLNEV